MNFKRFVCKNKLENGKKTEKRTHVLHITSIRYRYDEEMSASSHEAPDDETERDQIAADENSEGTLGQNINVSTQESSARSCQPSESEVLHSTNSKRLSNIVESPSQGTRSCAKMQFVTSHKTERSPDALDMHVTSNSDSKMDLLCRQFVALTLRSGVASENSDYSIQHDYENLPFPVQESCCQVKSADTKFVKCAKCGTKQERFITPRNIIRGRKYTRKKFSRISQFSCNCRTKFPRNFCVISKYLTGKDDQPFHCEKFGICRYLTTEKSTGQEYKCNPTERLLEACLKGHGLKVILLVFESITITVRDLWSLIPPNEIRKYAPKVIMEGDIIPGWLTDTIIDAFMWKLSITYDDVFVANSCLCALVQQGENTDMLWSRGNFNVTNKILIPLNIRGNHWTLLVINKATKTVSYFNPTEGCVHEVITIKTSHATLPAIRHRNMIIKDICTEIDKHTGWNLLTWSIIQPEHYTQTDNFNCGIIICLFAQCLCEPGSLEVNKYFNMRDERHKITSAIFGSCYDDIKERKPSVCKICKAHHNANWPRRKCDACGQFFHTRCLNINFGSTLQGHFVCP